MYQQQEQAQSRRAQAEKAIQLAMANRWEDAVTVNSAIISLFPNDVDAHNRLGKAFMELGRYNEAKKAYQKALELDSTNQIAKKNLERLGVLAKAEGVEAEGTQVDPTLFIEQMGKSAVVTLQKLSPNALPRLDAGERVELRPEGNTLVVETTTGERIGEVEPKLSLRLIKLMEGGNQYAAAVTSVSADECRVIIKETFQHPSQAGRPSFPATVAPEGLRPYTKERLLRDEAPLPEAEEEPLEAELAEEGEAAEGWETETELQEGDVRLYEAAAAEEAEEEPEE